MPFFFLILIIGVHNVCTANRVEDQGKKPHGEPQQYSREYRVPTPHVVQSGAGFVISSVQSDSPRRSSVSRGFSGKNGVKEYLDGLGRELRWVILGKVVLVSRGVDDEEVGKG